MDASESWPSLWEERFGHWKRASRFVSPDSFARGGNPPVQYSTRADLLKTKKAEVRIMTQAPPNAAPEPVDPDAASSPAFESEEVLQYYEDGLLPRSEADVYDVLFSTGFAQE